MKRKLQIPVCSICGKEVDFGHICVKCRYEKYYKKKIIKETTSLQEEPTRVGIINIIEKL